MVLTIIYVVQQNFSVAAFLTRRVLTAGVCICPGVLLTLLDLGGGKGRKIPKSPIELAAQF